MCRCGCIEGMKRRNLAVVLEGSEQLFRGITIYMGQKHRSVSRVTEHKGGGGGGSGTNIRTPLRSDMHYTLFFFLTESTDFCCFNSWDWQLHMENLLWAHLLHNFTMIIILGLLNLISEKRLSNILSPLFAYITVQDNFVSYLALPWIKDNQLHNNIGQSTNKEDYKGQHSANYIKDTAIFSLILSVFEITIREGQKLLTSKR